MRLLYALVLVVGLAACAGPSGALRLSDAWFVVEPHADPVSAYASASGSTAAGDLSPGERYQIVARRGHFYQVRTAEGQDRWITTTHTPTAYDPVTHGSAETLAVRVREYRTCSSFATHAEAQAAFAAGNTALDGDGDGVACEWLGSATARRPAPTAGQAAPSSSGRSGNCHWVSGHTRRGRNGRTTTVRGHMRCR